MIDCSQKYFRASIALTTMCFIGFVIHWTVVREGSEWIHYFADICLVSALIMSLLALKAEYKKDKK